ncbi:MAG: T9SS type A sorting domain-containing protein [bacterium]
MKIKQCFMRTACFFMLMGLLGLKTVAAQDYYPTYAGNRWDYEVKQWWANSTDTTRRFNTVNIIGDTLMPNGFTYAYLDSLDFAGGRFVRADTEYVYYYDEFEDQDIPLFKLQATLGESWEVRFGPTTNVTLVEVDTVALFGETTTVKTFLTGGLLITEVSLSDKFGPVSYFTPGEPPGLRFTTYNVMGCVIAGKSYGSATLSYFPMAVGNFWAFAGGPKEVVTDTVQIDDSLYYHFDNFCDWNNVLLRLTSSQDLLLKEGAAEQVWLKFSAEIGEQWHVIGPQGLAEWTVILQSKTDTVKVPAGTFVNCYRFRFKFDFPDNDWIEWHAPGVGPVKREHYSIAPFFHPLDSALVNGKRYPPLSTSVADEEENTAPEEFQLLQNYPNPFNPVTSIQYAVGANGGSPVQVSLKVYDVLGKEVVTLVNEKKPAGNYRVSFDASNLSSGVYFYKLFAGDFVKTLKMLLIR